MKVIECPTHGTHCPGHYHVEIDAAGNSSVYCPRCQRLVSECPGHIRVQRELPLPELSAVEVHRVRQLAKHEAKINAHNRKRAKRRRNSK